VQSDQWPRASRTANLSRRRRVAGADRQMMQNR
jgi:hypothetical protein